MNPSLAVIVPVRNGMPFLPETIDSILAQRYTPLQIVLVDDGSTDDTAQFISGLRSPSIQVLSLAGVGPSAARNAGVRATNSELIAFLDADDLWPPGALRALIAALRESPAAQFARGRICNFGDAATGERRFLTPPYRFINLGSCIWRRSLLADIGLLDQDLRLCEDLDLMLRCWERDTAKAEIDDVVLHYRRHPRSMTHGLDTTTFGTLKAFKKHIDRIRAGAFDPAASRLYRQDAYLGTPPPNQDGKPHVPHV